MNKLINTLSVKLFLIMLFLFSIGANFTYIRMYHNQRDMAINYMSKCDRIAIVRLDDVLIKSGLSGVKSPTKEALINSVNQYEYTDSAILLGYRLRINNAVIELMDDSGGLVATVVNGRRMRKRGVGDFEMVHH